MKESRRSSEATSSVEKAPLGHEYEVFLSWGPDTRYNFTDYLYHRLKLAGVSVFLDNEELHVGNEIDGELLKVLERSHIYVPIFSKGYATSLWCLREIVFMVESTSKFHGKKEILPIFYDVYPEDVGLKTQLYGDAILRNLEKYSSDLLDRWMDALRSVGRLKGWFLNGGRQGELIELIVDEVSRKLSGKNVDVPEALRRDSESTLRIDYASGEVNEELKRESASTSRIENECVAQNQALRRDSESILRTNNASEEKYDVYLNFRGPDTRHGFADCLYHGLRVAGMHVFMERGKLRVGKAIKGELLKGLDKSQIYIPIFSKNYASSRTCLWEITVMVESTSKSDRKKEIFPIFYDVQPDDVALKTPLYRDAILELEKMNFHSYESTQWMAALTKVARLKGWLLTGKRQGELIDSVVEEVSWKLSGKHVDVPEALRRDSESILRTDDKSREEYEVYLNFRGLDTGNGFADCLRRRLRVAGIHVFFDDEELRVTEEISGELLKVLDKSQIYIAIFSKNYATSSQCLHEVEFMVESTSKSDGKKEIIPIFYDVDFFDVSLRTRLYREAIHKHEEKFGSCQSKRWADALRTVAHLKGWTLKGRGQGELIEFVVEVVSLKLRRKHVDVPEALMRDSESTLRTKEASGEENRVLKWDSESSSIMDCAYGKENDVFLSFRGEDTRNGFTDCLFHRLKVAGIHVFLDDEGLQFGKAISRGLLQALDESRIYIPIFSKQYANSTWCLREIAHAVESTSKSDRKKKILPIFYDVLLDDVALKTPLYNDAICKLEEKLDSDEPMQWRDALRKAARLNGWELTGKGYGEVIESVVEAVSRELGCKHVDVPEHLVEDHCHQSYKLSPKRPKR